MAMSGGGRADDEPIMDMNTTPLIDVLLVLLIMFIRTPKIIVIAPARGLLKAFDQPAKRAPSGLKIKIGMRAKGTIKRLSTIGIAASSRGSPPCRRRRRGLRATAIIITSSKKGT